jgi:proteasome accessory factor B
MKRTKSQFGRLLELDRRIRDGKYPNCLTFAADWEVSQKTIQRDIDYLRDMLGAPIEYDREKKGFYYAEPSWFLPALNVSEGDLLAILIAERAAEAYRGTPVAEELERVFRRLADMLPEKISLRPELAFTQFSFTAPPSRPIDEDVWACVVRGLMTQRRVRMKYRSFEAPKATDRLLSPYHMANMQGEWYVFGAADDDPEVRQYALARIESAALTPHAFIPPPDFDPKKLLRRTFGRMAVGEKCHKVRLLFDKSVAEWVTEREWHPGQRVVCRRNGDIELSFEAYGLLEIQRWVLAWGSDVRVLAPEELERAVREEIRRMAARR